MVSRIVLLFAITLSLAFSSTASAQCQGGQCPPQFGQPMQYLPNGYGGQPGLVIPGGQPGLVIPGGGQGGQYGGGQAGIPPFDPGGNDPRFPPGSTLPGTTPPADTTPADPNAPKPQTQPGCCEELNARFDAIDAKLEELAAKEGCSCDNDELLIKIKELQVQVQRVEGSVAGLGKSQESIKKQLDSYDSQLKQIQLEIKNSIASVTKEQQMSYQKLTQTLAGGVKFRLQFDPNTGTVTQIPD